jgi:hypothetical protein
MKSYIRQSEVNAVNQTNELMNRLFPVAQDLMKEWEGKKMVKVDGSLTAKFREASEQVYSLRGESNNKIRLHAEYGSLYLYVKTMGRDSSDSVSYCELDYCLGKLDSSQYCSHHERRTDYTLEEYLKALKEHQELMRQAYNIESQFSQLARP